MADAANSTDPTAAAALAAAAEAQHFIFVTQIYFCCMYAVVVWDWIVSFPREYKFIWRASWTSAKISYLFCRYWVLLVMPYILTVFVTNHSWEACQKLYRSPVALAMWNQAGAEVVLLIRTYAFFNRNKYLLVALCVGLAGVLAYQLFVVVDEMLPLPFIPPLEEGPCFPMSKPGSAHILGFFMASLAFDATVTSMTLWKAFQLRRTCGAAASPLIQTFLREGIFYFVFISIANLVNGIFYLQPKAVMSAINIPLSIMFSDILACRMILDLRQRGYEISQPTVFTRTRTLPLHTNTTDGTEGTSTFSSGPSSLHKGPFSSTENSLPYSPTAKSPSRGQGVNGLDGNGRSATSTTQTTTFDSVMLSSQTYSVGDVRSPDGSSSVEMRSLTPQYDESDPEEKSENGQVVSDTVPTHDRENASDTGKAG